MASIYSKLQTTNPRINCQSLKARVENATKTSLQTHLPKSGSERFLDVEQCCIQLHIPSSCNGVAKQRHVVAQQWDSEMPSHLSFQEFPELGRARVICSHCDCMYALACLWEGRHSKSHTTERKSLTQVTRTQLRRCLLFSSLWHYRGQHHSDGVNNRQSSLHSAAACWTPPLAMLS